MPKQLTSKQLDLYDELRQKILLARRKLIRRRRDIESERGGRMQALPALVIPKRPPSRNVIMRRPDPWKAYRHWLQAMKQSISMLKEHRKNYFIAFRDILHELGKVNFKNGRITQEEFKQHQFDDETIINAMHYYNRMFNLAYGKNGLEKFSDMYERGYVEQLRWIYDELQGTARGASFIEEAMFLTDLYTSRGKVGHVGDNNSTQTYTRAKIRRGGKK